MKMHDDHDRHDRFLVAALAADDLDGKARVDADELVAACSDCAELLADLRSIAAATAALPPMPRSMDFRLSPETAERLAARGWRGFLVRLADSRFGFSRPLAVGLTTLGLVGVIAGSIPGAMGGFGSGTAALPAVGNDIAREQRSDGAVGAAPPATGAPTAAPGGESVRSPMTVTSGSPAPTSLAPAPTAATQLDTASAPPSAADRGYAAAATPPTAKGAGRTSGELLSFGSGPGGPSPLLVGSLVLLLIGLGILGTQWAATRLTNRSPDRP
jgi:hypothetical protein